jgi:hypothetical protein
VKSPPVESYRLYAAAGALLMGGPVWHYLYVNHYPFSQPEALLLVLGATLAGVAVALAAHRLGGWVETLGFSALLFLFIDLQFDLDKKIIAPILLACVLGLSLLLRTRRAVLTCITLGAFYLAALPRAGTGIQVVTAKSATPAAARKGPASAPVLVHVILDEEWGVGGLQAEGDSATAAFLTDFYLSRGFELYPAAYSRYNHTAKSIPAIVSLGEIPRVGSRDSRHRNLYTLHAIPYFELLRAQGYNIRAFQSTFLEFCLAPGAPVLTCDTQPANTIINIAGLGGSWRVRTELALRYLLNMTSHLYRRMHPDAVAWRRSTPGGGLMTLRRVRDAIAAGSAVPTAYFIHVLLPHRPLELDDRCRALADPSRRVGDDMPASFSDSTWAATIGLVGGQTRCAHQVLAEVLAALDSTVGRDNSIVIIQGDHGARVYQHRPDSTSLASWDERQLNGGFSTLLAIRRPGVPGTIHSEPVPVQDFLWRLVRQDFKGPVSTDFPHFVRASPSDSIAVVDSIRWLTRDQMPWARARP